MSDLGPRNYKGTRDWLASDASVRNRLVETLKLVFELFGYEPLETPVVELRSTLFGKGGDETNNLIYTFLKGHDELGLRFDHTVPLARVVAQHEKELVFPYRRYATGPVFRADKPQKGRYRQFTQCDFDMVGSSNPLADAEVIALSYTALVKLGFTTQFRIHVFDRHALNGMAHALGAQTQKQVETILRSWDKLAKVGRREIAVEVEAEGLDPGCFNQATDQLLEVMGSSGSNEAVVDAVERLFSSSEDLEAGLSVLRQILSYLDNLGIPSERVQIDPTLARGLAYYTGPIFETVVEEAGVGSITGGGRFDTLIEQLGGPSIPATGSSFGLERMVEVLYTLGITKPERTPVQVFVANFDPKDRTLTNNATAMATRLRSAGVKVELFTGNGSLGKQLHTADRRGVPFAVFAGPDEISNGDVIVKSLREEFPTDGVHNKTSNQRQVALGSLVAEIQALLPS
ncbi:MAG: histidine--tRNA ligase [Candidatus Blackburnbacteria bacterium]|nr:histidine--tRNA ligase [Candidatus Blackburnbacteria bacterium]